jgi:hypothetical protein
MRRHRRAKCAPRAMSTVGVATMIAGIRMTAGVAAPRAIHVMNAQFDLRAMSVA